MFELAYPWLLLLLPAPLAARRWLPESQRQQASLRVPFFAQWQALSGSDNLLRQRQGRLALVALWLIWVSFILALSRPQWVGEPVSVPASGRDLLLAVDLSGSMKEADMEWQGEPVTRLAAVKAVVSDFVRRRENDRLGLILFGTRAYLQAPLTFDRVTVEKLLLEAQLGFAGEKTAIGDAIGLATKRLLDRPSEERVLILLTDGANTAGAIEPGKAAELARQAGIKIYTVGVGAEFIENSALFGLLSHKRRNTDIDENALRAIAETSGGHYFRAHNSEELDDIYHQLDELEPVEVEEETFRPIVDLFHWPLALSLVLLGVLGVHRYHEVDR